MGAAKIMEAQLLKAEASERAENPNLPITQTVSETTISTSKAEVAHAEAALAAAERDQVAAQSHVLEVEANVVRIRSRMGVLKGVARVDGRVVFEGTMTFALGDPQTD